MSIKKDSIFGSVEITEDAPTWAHEYKGCPSCARIAAKMKDREGLARIMYAFNDDSWRLLDEHTKNSYRNTADAVIRWMEE